jgi:hypothetical protein
MLWRNSLVRFQSVLKMLLCADILAKNECQSVPFTLCFFTSGVMPLEVRFLHDPKSSVGFVGCALFGKVFKFFQKEDGTWDAKKVIDVPAKKVEG